MMTVYESIRTKRAVREFLPEPLEDDDIHTILYAGRRAQSAKNMQPWHFIAIRNSEILTKLSKLGTWAGHLANAPFAVAIITPHPDTRFSIMFDAGQSAAYMQLVAWELGIGSCPATIYDTETARQLLGFPEELHIRIAISFGYPQDANILSRPPRKDGRRSSSEVIHWETW